MYFQWDSHKQSRRTVEWVIAKIHNFELLGNRSRPWNKRQNQWIHLRRPQILMKTTPIRTGPTRNPFSFPHRGIKRRIRCGGGHVGWPTGVCVDMTPRREMWKVRWQRIHPSTRQTSAAQSGAYCVREQRQMRPIVGMWWRDHSVEPFCGHLASAGRPR